MDQLPLPLYKCHKEVRALKIANIEFNPGSATPYATITPADKGYIPFDVDRDYVRKHLSDLTRDEIIGGYYVVYEDGYKSFSPAKAFEDGYSAMQAEGQ